MIGTTMLRAPHGFALLLAFSAASCDWLQDRFRTCGHLQVDLTNSMQSIGPVHVLAHEELASDATLLASGSSRRILLCVERGDAKRFRALTSNGLQTLAVSNCTVSRGRYEYEATISRVVWYPSGLACENW